MQRKSGKRQRGFTLIEIMIAVAILGILVAVALPSYQAAIRKSNRADAQITLSRLATLQERYYFGNNGYTGSFADIISGAAATVASDEGHYSISLAGTATSWTMVATAVGDQAKDTDCVSLTLTSLGAKTALNSSNAASPDCW